MKLRWQGIAIALAAALACGGVALATITAGGRIGPDLRLLGNGRQLNPAGTLVPLGNFPTGGAVTPNGRFYWTVSTGRGFNDIRIVDLSTNQVIQTVPLPGASGGIVMAPTGNVAYVSGVADSPYADQSQPGLPGRGGDVVHVLTYDPSTGQATLGTPIPVPPPSGTLPPQNFPPTTT